MYLICKKKNSQLVICLLFRCAKAFDNVWHNGLFVKLYEKGIKPNLLRSIIDLHNGMKSCVLCKGNCSDWFPVLQGTRQGGVLSPVFDIYAILMISSMNFCIVHSVLLCQDFSKSPKES